MKLIPIFALLLGVTAAGPALAGNPQSTGLTLTEAVARQARSTVSVPHHQQACLVTAAASVRTLPGLVRVAVRPGELQAIFASPDRADAAKGETEAAVSNACGPLHGSAATN